MSLTSLVRPSSLVEEVCARLSEEIRSELNGGDGWLPPERQLAEQLGVSRNVVREATKRLELQGLIEVQHGIGIKVVDKLHKPLNGSLDLLLPRGQRRLEQFIEVRRVMEPEIARLAALRAKPGQRRALRETQSRFAATTDIAAAVECDLEFHRRLAEASGNQVFALLLESLAELGRQSRQQTLAATGIPRAVEHHEAILRAVEAGDAAAAESAMRHHMMGWESDLKTLARAKRKTK
jgi:GntR family transcriptional repressor for pyruvate dehydrogenase complex